MKKIGTITKPQGVKGEFRVKPSFFDYADYKNFKEVKFNNKIYDVQKVVLREGFVIFKVSGIETRNEVELLRNVDVFADIQEELNEDEFYVSDMIGAKVISDNLKTVLGTLTSIDQFGASDIYTVKQENGNEFLFPNVRDVITDIDIEKKEIYVDEIVLLEIRSDVEWK